MKRYLDWLARAIFVAVIVAVCVGGVYGLAKLGKTLTYKWWYQDMVQQTVREMVRDSALR